MEEDTQNNTNEAPQSKTSNKPKVVLISGILIAVLALGFGLYRSLNSKKTSLSEVSPTPAIETQNDVQGTDTFQSIEVEGGSYYFKPNEIKVKVGQKVTITFKNVDGFHDFVVDELNLKTSQINAGQSETLEFTPDKTGSYEFYCSVGTHRAMGMKGILIVE